MTVTISRLYDGYSTAQQVVNDLEAVGLRSDDISIVASNADNWYKSGADSKRTRTAIKDKDHDGKDDRVEGAETGAGIGETRSIHMEPQPMFFADRRQRVQLLNGVNAACFGGLTDSHRARLGKMNVRPIGGDLMNSLGRQFPVVAFGDHQLGTIGKELRRTAFVGLYMS